MQGSTHFRLMQALFLGHSEFRTHSGRQPKYGLPRYSGKQVHSPFRHWAFDPQGEGLHGSSAIGSSSTINYVNISVRITEWNLITWRNGSFVTPSKWISDQSVHTGANWCMIYYMAFSSNSTHTNAGITAFFVNASLIVRAIGINRTLCSTIRWCAEVIRKARTWGNISIWLTLTVRTTRCRITGIRWLRCVVYYRC